ncbi:hypothetical protein [Mucilaginibacter glaciei]|uniref:Uncharacterized protein n=1 Tax=Mucilaginibacter glaciei TaxID=2772109 RepID=A0A926NMX2_9SPHI|nr:hypothetical protein [Mucilaginibacter glaciei]MBD1392656.1 hypothetical protein [Mucilaginibacter glaciei]
MMKLFKIPALVLALIVLANTNPGYAQDTTKKAKTAAATSKAAVYNPYTKKYYYKKPAGAAAQTPGAVTPAGTAQVTPAKLNEVTPPVAAPVDKTLRGQYAYLLTKVYNYQQPLVAALFKNYSDTLNVTRRQLKEANSTLAIQTKTIDTLKTSVSTKDQTLAQSQAKVDEVSLLGMPIKKSTYNLIMWGLVIVFGVIAAIVIARSGSHSREAKYRIKLYEELEEEYKTYKAKANEKEKKLARELQTERNKLDDLLGNG